MSITWPSGVPDEPLSASIEEGARNTVLRSPMETGPAKQRRRFRAGPRPISFAIPMTRAEVGTFEAWFEDTLADGALSFDFTHPRSQATVTLRFIGGQPPRYQWEQGGQTVQVMCTCEVLP
jgi:hypothetical protein